MMATTHAAAVYRDLSEAMQRFHYEVIDSTNSEARRLANAHADQRLVVTADRQSAGRGRHGRVWQSPPGGAWMSIVWPVEKEPRFYAPISLVTAVAVRRALRDVACPDPADLRIKWPNDVLLAGRKVAGILCEQYPASASRPGVLIVGIGVNVSFDPGLVGDDLRHPATTLATALGRDFAVTETIAAVTDRTSRAIETFEREGLSPAVLDELQAHLAYVGTVQTWTSPRGTIRGRILGIDPAGRLRLESGGQEIACEVGELARETPGDAL